MDPQPPAALLVSRDLFFSSRITGTASEMGCAVDVAGDPETAVARLRERAYRLVLIDLTLDIDLGRTVTAIREAGDTFVVAFGPHVQTLRLDAARAAGCNEVLPRSRFSAALPQILRERLLAPAGQGPADE